MPTNDAPTWEDTLPDQTPVTAPPAPPAPPAASGEPSWEDTTPDVAPSPLPDFKIKLTPEQELQQKGLLEPGMGAITGPDTPEDKARALRALPQALELPFAAVGQAVAAGARALREDALNPLHLQRPKPFIISPTEIRPMTDEEIASRDQIQQGKPIFQFPRTELQPESGEGQRMIEGLLTPENLALLPEAGGRAGAAALLASTVPGLVQQITQVVSGKGTEEQKRDAVNSLLIPALLMTRAHAFPGGRAVTTPGDLTESMQVPPPITFTGGEIPGRPKGAPAPIVPPVEIARATPEQAAAAASRMQRTATAAFEPRVGPPEVPTTPAEPREDVITTIRKAGARTRAEIQKLFPGRELSREEAGQLRDQAWPADVDERAIQQAEATRQANAAAEQARRARIMAPATAPAPPRAAEPTPQPTTAEDFIKLSPADVVKWKTAIKYGPSDPARIAAGMTPADIPKLLTEISRLRQDEVRIRNQMENAVNARDEARLNQLMQEHGPVSLKAQTLREIAEELSKSTPEEEQVTLYQGQGAEGGGGSDTRFFTKNPERAATYGPDVYSVTVPKSVADAAAAAAKKSGSGTSGDYVLPQEWVKKAEKMPSPPKQVVHEIPTGEEPTPPSLEQFNKRLNETLDSEGISRNTWTEEDRTKAFELLQRMDKADQAQKLELTRLLEEMEGKEALQSMGLIPKEPPIEISASARARLQARVRRAKAEGLLGGETGQEPPAAPAAPPAARTPIPRLSDDQIRKLRLLGLSNREISDIQTGKPVNQVVIDKLPVDLTRGEDHAAANEEARQQAVKDINKIISPSPAAPEPKYLGKPISYWEGIIENLPKGTERERLARSLGVANQPSKIIQYLRKRINDMRAAGVKPAKISFAAYIPPGQTVPEVGANHPEILKRLGVPGFETPESRNTPQFGFTDEEGNFLTREQAAERAKLTGQDLKEFEPGEPAHSDEIASPTEPTKPISEAKSPVPAETAPAAPPAAPGELISVAPTESVNAQLNAIVALLQQLEEENPRGELVAKDIDIPELDKLVKPIADVLHEDMGKLAEENSAGLVKLLRNRLHEMEAAKATGQPVPELPPAPKQQPNLGSARVARAWNLWNEDPNATTRDLLETIEGYIEDHPQDIPEGLQKAAQAYREAIEEDYELKGRGETEPAADAFESEVSKIAGEGAIKPESYPVRPATKPAKPATKAVKPETKPAQAAPITPTAEVAKPAPTAPEAPKAPAAPQEPGKPFEPTWSPAFKKMIAERDNLKARLDGILNKIETERRIGGTGVDVTKLVSEANRIRPRYQQLQDAIFDEAWRQERAALPTLPPATISEPVITPKVLKAQRADLLSQVDQAIKSAPETGEEKITFDVEGDGSFTVANTQANLKAFRALAAKEFPTTVEKGAKVAGASTTKSGKPAPMPDASAEPDLTQTQKVIAQFTSDDPSRQTIQSAYADGSQIVATDGQQLIRFKGFSPGTAKNPVRVDSEGKVIDFGDQQFPNFSAVIPKDPTLVKGNVPTDSLWKMLRQASTFAASFDKEPAVQLFLNPDGSFGVKVDSLKGDTFEHNVQKTSKDLGFYTAGPLFDGIDAMRRLGNDSIDIYADGRSGPIEFNGKNAQYIRMPMKLEQHKETGNVRDNPDRIPLALAGTKAFSRDVPPPPVTPKVSMGPGAAARAEFEEGPPSIEAAGVDRIDMPAWDKAMAKYRNLKEGIEQLFTRRTTKADFSLISNAIYNIPRYFGQIAAKSLRLRANDVERRAVTFLMQALKMSGDGLSADDAERLGQLEHAGDPTGYLKTRGFDMKTAAEQFRNEGKNLNAAAAQQAAQAMAIALEKYNQLLPIARRARRQFDAQLTREANAGIDTEYENWYVPQRHDLDLMPTANRPIVLGDPRGGGSQAFQKAKVFEDYATAIEKGFVPRSLDIADLLEHRVNQGERMVQKKIFFDKLANYKDPVDGNPLVTKIPKRVIKRPDGDIRVQEHIPRGYEAIEPMPGIRLAVHKGYARLVRALTGNSQIGESALVGALQDLAAVEKHLGLALDTFHASRTLQAELALTGRVSIGPRLKRGLALVEYHPRDLDLAVKQGLITQEMADWVTTRNPMQVGGRELELSPYQIVNIGARNGLQMARVADVMYREWTRQIPISGAVNKWVFDKMTRSAISQAFVQEFERVAKNNPHLNANGVGRMVAREINTFFGNIGKEGIFKNPSLSTLNQIIWLAPKWIEALATREARAAKQAGEIPFKLARGEHITIPTTLKGIGTGLGAYFVATQLLNLFTRHQFTFQNQEEGHKLDAWIPDVTGKTRGFFISPLSVFGEITHDIIRYAREKPDFATAVAAILGNKLGNLARAGEILVSGRDPVSGEKLLGSARRALTAAVQLVPAPISLSQVGRWIGHELFPATVPAPAPGAVQRQLTSTFGFKTEPAGSAQQQVFNMVDAWKRSSPNHKIRYQLEQRQKQDFGPSDYRDMRNALIRGDLSQASRAYDKLLENRTPKDIRRTLEHPHPFTGSEQYERAFVSSLTPEQRQTYQAAIQERRALARTFEDMLRQRYANQRQVGAPSTLSP